MNTTTNALPEHLEAKFLLMDEAGRKLGYTHGEVAHAKDFMTFLPPDSRPRERELADSLAFTKSWLRSGKKKAIKLLNKAAKNRECPIPVQRKTRSGTQTVDGAGFTEDDIILAASIAMYSKSPPKNVDEAFEFLVMAASRSHGTLAYPAYVEHLARASGFSDSVAQAVIQRHLASAPASRDTLLGWLNEEKEFQKEPFDFAWTICGGERSPDPMHARAVGIAMRHILSNGGLPAGLAHLGRKEQALALLREEKYAKLAQDLARRATARSEEAAPQPKPPTPTVDSPDSGLSKDLLNKAASEYIEMRRVRSRDMEALRIIREYPALPLVLQKAYKAAAGEDISISDATSLLVEGPKGTESRRTGRAGLLQFFEALKPKADPSIEILELVVKREKRKMENGARNTHEEKKAELNGWLAVQQMPSVIRELISKFGKGSESIDNFSVYALADSLEHVRKTGMVVGTPEHAMELFQYMRWKSRVSRQIGSRISSGLMSKEAGEEAKISMLQDERLRQLRGFPSSDAEIEFYVSLFERRGEGYPTKLVMHLLYKRGDISDAVYKDLEKRFDTENPSISNIGELNQFISDSWKVAAEERVAKNKSRGSLPDAVSNRVLNMALGDGSAKGKFPTPHQELALYIRACQELNEPYPAKLSLFIQADEGKIPQEVLGAALMRIYEEKLVFADGNEFMIFVGKVREHVLFSDPLTSGRKSYARNAFQGTMQVGSEDSGLLAIETGHGLPPYPAPSMPPSSESINIPLELAPGRAKAGPAAIDSAKTAELEAPVLPHAIPPRQAEDGAGDSAKTIRMPAPEVALGTSEADLHGLVTPPAPSADALYPKIPPKPDIEAAMETAGTTQLPAPRIPAALAAGEPEGMATTQMPAPVFPEAPPAADARSGMETAEIPVHVFPPEPSSQEEEDTIQLPAPAPGLGHAETMAVPAPAIEAEEAPLPHPAPKRVDTSPVVREYEAKFFGPDDPIVAKPGEQPPAQFFFQLGMPQAIPAPAAPEPAARDAPRPEAAPSEGHDTVLDDDFAQAAMRALDSIGVEEAPPKRKPPLDIPPILRSIGYAIHELRNGRARLIPIQAVAPANPQKADSEIFADLLESTLFSASGPEQRAAAATLLAANTSPERHVPLILRAYYTYPDISGHCTGLLSSRQPGDVLPHAFRYHASLGKGNLVYYPILELAERYGAAALPEIISYISRQKNSAPSTLESSDVSLALEMVKGAEHASLPLLEELLPVMDSVSEAQRLGIANFAKSIGKGALQPVVSFICANPGMDADSAIILGKAAREISGDSEEGAEVLSTLVPMMERMTPEQCSMVGVLAVKFGSASLGHILAHAKSGRMGLESAAVLSRAVESIGDARGRELMAHVLPLLRDMAESQVQRAEDLAVKFNCTDLILGYSSSRGKDLNMQEALTFSRLLAQIREVHKTGDGAEFVPFLMRLVDSMDSEQAEIAKAYAILFGEASVEHIESFVSFRGQSLTPREAAAAAYILANIPSEFAFTALKELLVEKNLSESRILGIHNAVKAELSSAYVNENARGFIVRSSVLERGPLSALGSISFEIIEEMESGPLGPSPDILKGCINQHLTHEADTGENAERLGKAREALVKFGDYAIDPLWAIGLSPDFSLYPAEHRTNIFRTIAHIAEMSASDMTKQKAKECLIEAVRNLDLSNAAVASALAILNENVVGDLFKLVRLNQTGAFQARACGIMWEMGETAQKQVSELLCSRDAYERFAGATMIGLMFVNDPPLGRFLVEERAKPEPERRLPTLQGNVRTLSWMLFDPHHIEGSQKEAVSGAAGGALRAVGHALDAAELEAVVRHRACDPADLREYSTEVETRAFAASLLASSRESTGAFINIFNDYSLDPETRKHALAESMGLGDEMLALTVADARGKGLEDKYLVVNAAFELDSPFSGILQMIDLGKDGWAQKLPSAGLEAGKVPEQWQEDLLRWTVVRGIVLRGSSKAAEYAHELCYSLGYLKPSEFADDLKAAIDKQAKDVGMLPSTKKGMAKYCVDLLASHGMSRAHLENALCRKEAPASASPEKYRGFLMQEQRRAKLLPLPQQRPRRNGNGAQ